MDMYYLKVRDRDQARSCVTLLECLFHLPAMSTDTPQPTEWLAIAFLVEASLSLSRDWKRLYRDYIGQLLQRCTIFPNPNKPVSSLSLCVRAPHNLHLGRFASPS